MRIPTLLAALALLAACDGKPSATAHTSPDAAAPIVPLCTPAPLPPPGPRPDLHEPRLAVLSRMESGLVDVAPGRLPDARFPKGTVIVAAVLRDGSGRAQPRLFEWDVASTRSLTYNPDGELFYGESDKVDMGEPAALRIAATRKYLYTVVTLARGMFTFLGRESLESFEDKLRSPYPAPPSDVPAARNISVEADDRWVSIAYEQPGYYRPGSELPRSGVLLYDAPSMTRVAVLPLRVSSDFYGRHDILEMIDGRLFAVESPSRRDRETKYRVVELEVPSLKVLRSTDVSVSGIVGSVQLTSARGHLFALGGEVLVELSTDLEIIGRRELHASEAAVGPGGELLTPVGLEAPGGRGDFVPDARASASCTPSWAGAYPLLACAVDMNGIRIARLAPR